MSESTTDMCFPSAPKAFRVNGEELPTADELTGQTAEERHAAKPLPEKLDDVDMEGLKRVMQAQANARQLQEQLAQLQIATQRAIGSAEGIEAFFMESMRPKYSLGERDQIAQSGQIMRGPVAVPTK